MKHGGFSLWLVAVLTLIPLVAACEREGPPRPVGTATNKHVEESPPRPPKDTAEAITGAVMTPLDKASQTEDTIWGAAGRTKEQAEKAGQ